MANVARTFRIFVSSTFADLSEERNALQERVFPKLSRLCAEHGARFQAIDLRWGVSEEASLDQQTMPLCFEEIERCRRTSPRPNFVVMLGQRYGWCPLPARIPANEFTEILARVSVMEADQLQDWYLRDDNAVPPEYGLRRRDGEYEVRDKWSGVESELHQILAAATEGMALEIYDRMKYVVSATEQEIANGALRVSDASDHVFCFFRHIEGLPNDARAGRFLDLAPDGRPDTAATARLARLCAIAAGLLWRAGQRREITSLRQERGTACASLTS